MTKRENLKGRGPKAQSPKGQSAVRLSLSGADGRMGRMIVKAVLDQPKPDAIIVAATGRANSEAIGCDIGLRAGMAEAGVKISAKAEDLFTCDAQAVVDFSTPESAAHHAMLAAEHGVGIVVGVTGLSDDHRRMLERAAQKTAIVCCANTSVGVAVLEQLVEDGVRMLGSGWDVEVVESHHKHKRDAPSGTALALGEAAARGRKVKLNEVMESARHGTDTPRKDGAIGFASLRGGDVVGEHSVIFYGESERIELTHRALDRMVFARGAVRAGIWAATAKPGLYSMKDVLES